MLKQLLDFVNKLQLKDKMMDVEKQVEKMIREGAFLVDVRSPMEFDEGTAKGAINIPLEDLEDRLADFEGKKNIVLFCRSGGRSAYAESVLNRNGINDTVNGGVWQYVDRIVREVEDN